MKTVKLDDVCDFKPAKSLAKNKLGGDIDVSFSPMEQLPIGRKYFTPNDTKKLDEVYSNYVYFKDNDVIYAKITPCFENGKMSIARNLKNGVGFGSSEFVPIRCSEQILPEYLYYFLLRPSFIERGSQNMHGASGHKRVPDDFTKELEIELPDIEEQRRVVEQLDAAFEKIDRAIELTEKNTINDKKLFYNSLEGKLASTNSEIMAIGDVCTITGGKRMPKGSKLSRHETKHPYIRVTDFDHEGGIDVSNLHFVPNETWPLIANYIITSDDVFLSIAGSVGITGIVPTVLNGANLTENACRIIPNKNTLDKRYLYYFTLTNSFKDQAESGTRTTAQPKLALTRIRDIKFAVPSLSEQSEIVNHFDLLYKKTKELEEMHTLKLSHLKSLKQSLLTQAFSQGEVE